MYTVHCTLYTVHCMFVCLYACMFAFNRQKAVPVRTMEQYLLHHFPSKYAPSCWQDDELWGIGTLPYLRSLEALVLCITASEVVHHCI
jgi:hypothetical protein